jgi:hypothetical protein
MGVYQRDTASGAVRSGGRRSRFCFNEPLIKFSFVKGMASEPILSEAEGCRKLFDRNAT